MSEILKTHKCELPKNPFVPEHKDRVFTHCDRCGQFYGSGHQSVIEKEPDIRKWWQKLYTAPPQARRVFGYGGWWAIEPIFTVYENERGELVNADGSPYVMPNKNV